MPRTNRPDSRGIVRTGTAGWSIASAHRHLAGPGASGLERYATLFDAVEINSSFYRPHRRETYVRWADSVPAHFRFSVKLPRTITHEYALRGALPLVDGFLAQAGALGAPRLPARATAAFAALRCARGRHLLRWSAPPLGRRRGLRTAPRQLVRSAR